MKQLAVFDLDGTLLDTLDDIADACNHALEAAGFPSHPRDAYKLFVGNGVHKLIRRALPPEIDEGAAPALQVEAAFRARYANHARDKTRPYRGIPHMLDTLGRAGLELAVLSNKPDENTRSLVERFFPGRFRLVFGQREGIPPKPHPQALLDILRELGQGRGDCVYIGDTAVDMQTGAGAGVDTVGVLWGFRTREELESAGAGAIITKPSALVDLLVDK